MRDISIPSIEGRPMGIHTGDAMIEAAPVAVCYFTIVCHVVTKIVVHSPNVVVPSSALSHNPRLYILHQSFAQTNSYTYSFIPSTKWNMLLDMLFPLLHLVPLNTIFLCLPCNRVHSLLAIATCVS